MRLAVAGLAEQAVAAMAVAVLVATVLVVAALVVAVLAVAGLHVLVNCEAWPSKDKANHQEGDREARFGVRCPTHGFRFIVRWCKVVTSNEVNGRNPANTQ